MRLMTRPQLADVGARQLAAAQGLFDEGDMRMGAYDSLHVVVTDTSAEAPEPAGRPQQQQPQPQAAVKPLTSFTALKGPKRLAKNMLKAGLNRPTPIQRWAPGRSAANASLAPPLMPSHHHRLAAAGMASLPLVWPGTCCCHPHPAAGPPSHTCSHSCG
jgi:hypothetical protein